MKKTAHSKKKPFCRIMVLLFALLFAWQIKADDTSRQMLKLSMNMSNTPIRSVLEKIESETSYSFLYNGTIVDIEKRISVKASNESVEQVLNKVFANTGITYTIVDSQIILSGSSTPENKNASQEKTVTGVITDESGLGIPGVSVAVKGTSKGTITDLDGRYTISVPENAVLIFSYIGYQNQEVRVGAQNAINISLREDTKLLDEVVVVGYSTQKKADLTGAVSSIKLDDVKNAAYTSMNHAMQGKMTGVTIVQDGGAPGASAAVRIRGLSTLNDKDPLYIIDGVPSGGMNEINPNDIERIDVLKDAASSAIYGSRAANGVVIIQTKKGKASDEVSVTFNAHAGFQDPINRMEVLNAEQRNTVHMEAYTNDGTPIPDRYKDPYNAVTRTDWQDEVFKEHAYIGSYDLSVLGGNDKARYAVMGGYYSNEGILKNSDFNRTNIRVNTDINLSKSLKLGENLMLSRTNTANLNTTSAFTGAYYTALMYMPDIPVYDANGNLSGVGVWGSDLQNPVGIVQRTDDQNKNTRILGNAYLEWSVMKGLTFKTDMGYDWNMGERKWFVPRIPEAGRQSNQNELNQWHTETTHWASTSTLKYDLKSGKHNLMALGGIAFEAHDSQTLSGFKKDFPSEDDHSRYMDAGNFIYNLTGTREEWALFSYFGRIDYSFDNKYIVALNFRTDASSKFSEDNRWGYFPSFSGGWRVSEERFFESLKPAFSNLKFRGSWGQLGNQSIEDLYPTYSKIRATTDEDGYYVVFGKGENAYFGRYESNIPNKNIRWETSTQWDLGTDMGFFDDKLEVTLDYFKRTTSDVLVQVPVPPIAGIDDEPYQNLGQVTNKGFEAMVAYHGASGDFRYDISGNISSIKNNVDKLNNGGDPIVGQTFRGYTITRTAVGEPMDYMWAVVNDGIFNSEAEIQNYKSSGGKVIQPNAKPGDLRFVDKNDDGVIDDKDRVNVGKGFPDLTYGVNFSGYFKNFDLSMFFQGVSGVEVFNATKYTGLFVDPAYNQFAETLERWTPGNMNGEVPRLTIKDSNSNRRMSSYYVEDGSYLRLKTITLGYTIKSGFLKKINVDGMRVYTTAQNLFTVTGYKGVDPELGQSGVDYGNFPQAKTFLFGFSLNF